MALSTRMLHADDHLKGERDVAPPISVTTTWEQPAPGRGGSDVEARMVYSRIDAPGRARAEALVSELEGGHAVLYASGLAALWAAMVFYTPARLVLDAGYHGTLYAVNLYGKKYGVEVVAYDAGPLQAGDLVWLETPRNPCCELVDVAAVAAACAAAAATLAVDATFAPPPLQRLLGLGADCVLHSTTKFMGGHSDMLGGALVLRHAAAASALKLERSLTGAVPGSLEVWLLMRSLRTLPLRVEAQSRSAQQLAAWLAGPEAPREVVAVHHPSLPWCDGHALAATQMPGGYGAMLSFELDSGDAAEVLPSCCQLFIDATSLGGVESLMEWRYKHDATVAVGLLRVSVGLEAPRDLINDIRQGVTRALKQQGRAASKPRGRALLANPNIHGGPVNHVA